MNKKQMHDLEAFLDRRFRPYCLHVRPDPQEKYAFRLDGTFEDDTSIQEVVDAAVEWCEANGVPINDWDWHRDLRYTSA